MRLAFVIVGAVFAVFACERRAIEGAVPDAACAEFPTCPEPGPLRVLVLGDRTGRPDDKLFLPALKEAARLKPDMILGVGDLIDGYQPDERLAEASGEWDHVIGMIRRALGNIPLYTTAGNHDVWSETSEALFEQKVGHPVNYSFDAGGARVILFDSSRAKKESDISDEALDWLVKELRLAREHTARIVVTHVPLFAISPGGKYGSPLHDVLIAGNADWVIAGHWHHAMSDTRDGIRYRMIGPTGTRPHRPEHPESGNFQQFGLMTVGKDGVELTLIPAGALRSADAFPYEMNQLEWRIENQAVAVQGFEFDPFRLRRSGSFHVIITNVAAEQLEAETSFRDEESGWRIRPESVKVSLGPGESTRMRLTFTRSARTSLFPGPRVRLGFPWPGNETYLLDGNLTPVLARKLRSSRQAPDVDGIQRESSWKNATDLGPPNRTYGPKPLGEVRVRLLENGDTLYLAARLEEPTAADQASVQGRASGSEGEDHLVLLVDTDPDDRSYLRLVVNPYGKLTIRRIGALDGAAQEITWTEEMRVAAVRDENGWSMELALPFDELEITPSTRQIGFNFARRRVRDGAVSFAYWQPLLDHDEPVFGRLLLKR